MESTVRRRALAGVALSAALALSACGGSPAGKAEPGQPQNTPSTSSGTTGSDASGGATGGATPDATSSDPTSTDTTSSAPTTSAGPSTQAAPPAGPTAPGKLPARIGTWTLITQDDWKSAIAATPDYAEVLKGLKVDVNKPDLAKQLGDGHVRLQKSMITNTNATLAGERGFYVEDIDDFRSGGVDRMLMVTAMKVSGPETAKFMGLKKGDFDMESKKRPTGLMKTDGRVLLQAESDDTSHGALVMSGNAWIETEIINDPDKKLDKDETAALVRDLTAVAPK